MTKKRIIYGVAFMVCLQLALGLGATGQAWAERHSLAMFHDALAPHGTWIDYGKYGPVWHPNQVSSTWRPYLDGRWVPSHAGWTFETSEPWGWATYHYGNWMPTTEYGWVWSPGSTWYPATAAWRTSDDYVGWAPIPPADYTPEPAFIPADYNADAPILDDLAAPLWIFVKAAQFLLGFGQPYTPAYSYYNSFNSLAPLDYASIVYGGTFPLTDFYYPGYAPGAYYAYGPPLPYVSRVTNVNIVQINNYVRDHHYRGMHNVLPPSRLMERYPYVREGIPAAVREGRRFPITRAGDSARVEHALNRPGIVPPPSNLPVQEGKFPRVTPSTRAVSPKNLAQLKGMALPREATQRMTPMMSRQVRLQRQFQGPVRMETRPEFRPLANPEVTPRKPEGVPQAPAKVIEPSPGKTVQPSPVVPPGHIQPEPSRELHATPRLEAQPAPGRALYTTPRHEVQPSPSREVHAAPRREVQPAPARRIQAPAAERYYPAPIREYRRPATRVVHPTMPREFRPSPPPVYRSAPRPVYHAPAPAYHAPAPARSAPAGPRHR